MRLDRFPAVRLRDRSGCDPRDAARTSGSAISRPATLVVRDRASHGAGPRSAAGDGAGRDRDVGHERDHCRGDRRGPAFPGAPTRDRPAGARAELARTFASRLRPKVAGAPGGTRRRGVPDAARRCEERPDGVRRRVRHRALMPGGRERGSPMSECPRPRTRPPGGSGPVGATRPVSGAASWRVLVDGDHARGRLREFSGRSSGRTAAGRSASCSAIGYFVYFEGGTPARRSARRRSASG